MPWEKIGRIRPLEFGKEKTAQLRTLRNLRTAVLVLSGLLLLSQVVAVAIGWRSYQYDFRTYYVGPALVTLGEDPYSMTAHVRLALSLGLEPKNLPFVYPPHMLAVFAPLSWLPYPVAYGVWMAVEVAALLTIIFLSCKRLGVDRSWLLVLLALGLNGTTAACLRSGQMALIFTAMTLLAACYLRRGRFGLPTFLLTLAALPKIWLAPMIGLILCKPTVRNFMLVAMALGAIASVLLLDLLLAPGYSDSFIAAAQRLSNLDGLPTGPIDNSLKNFMKTAGHALGVDIRVVLTCWVISILAITSLTLSSCRRLLKDGLDRVPTVVFLAMLGLSLIVPRFLVYQWCFVIPAVAFVVPKIESRLLRIAIVVMALTPTLYINRYLFGIDLPEPVQSIFAVPWVFSNVIVVFLVWLAALRLR